MNRDEAKQFLVDKIISLQGCKATQLAADEEVVTKLSMNDIDVPDLLDELVKEGRIIEIEYVLPEMTWRVKSFYLPPGTCFVQVQDEKTASRVSVS
jgi:hypothetical protein